METIDPKFNPNDFMTEEQWPTNFMYLNIFGVKKRSDIFSRLNNSMKGFPFEGHFIVIGIVSLTFLMKDYLSLSFEVEYLIESSILCAECHATLKSFKKFS